MIIFKMNPLICEFGGGGGGGGDTETTIRYAPYIEDKHKDFLNTVATKRNAVIGDSPYTDYSPISIEEAFFGVGYVISSFPSLYDMYGKFMAGLDIDTLYNQIFEETVNSSEVNALVSAEDALRQDEIDMVSMPDIELGARNVNSVVSSVFPVAQAAVYDGKVKAIEQFSAKLRYGLIPVATDRWKAHLNWNKQVIATYESMLKLYMAGTMDVTEFNTNMDIKDKLWPFTVLDYERAALGALTGATKSTSEADGEGGVGGFLSGVAGGAAAGSIFGAPGAMIGGAIGGIASLF